MEGVSGWCQWQPARKDQHRRLNLLPYFNVWYGRAKKRPYFIARVIFSIEFGWLFWNGQLTVKKCADSSGG